MEIPENIKLFANMTWALRGLAFKLRGRYTDGSCSDIEKPSDAGMPEELWIDLAAKEEIKRWSGNNSFQGMGIHDLFESTIFGRRQGMNAPMAFINLAVPIPHPWFINRTPGLLVTIMGNNNPPIEEPARRRIDGWNSVGGRWIDFANDIKSRNQWQSQDAVPVLRKNFKNLNSENLFLSVLPIVPTVCRPPDTDKMGKVIGNGRINDAYLEVLKANQFAVRWKNDGLLNDHAAVRLFESIESLFEVILEALKPLEAMDPGFVPEFRNFAKPVHAG